MASTNKTLIQDFYTAFQAAQADLLARVGALKAQATPSQDDVNALALDIAKLRKDLSDGTDILPAYDQRQYEQGLKSLEYSLEELRSSSTGKSKFSFKRKTQRPAAASALTSVSGVATQLKEQSSGPGDEARFSNSVTLTGRNHQYLSWSSVPSMTVATTDLSISDLDSCVVNFLSDSSDAQPLSFTALHMRNVTNSVLLLPFVQGSAMVHNMHNCVVVLGCHQFRMHNSSQVDVYLSIDSNPVIEHCSKLRFAQHPTVIQHSNATDDVQQHSNRLAVQDFSHIRATPSPNWTMLPPSDCVTSESWRDAAAVTDVDKVLTKLLPVPEVIGVTQ